MTPCSKVPVWAKAGAIIAAQARGRTKGYFMVAGAEGFLAVLLWAVQFQDPLHLGHGLRVLVGAVAGRHDELASRVVHVAAPVGHDAIGLDGGRLVVVPQWTRRSPDMFYELLERNRVTVLNQTPSAFRQLMWAEESAGKQELSLRLVIFGGETNALIQQQGWDVTAEEVWQMPSMLVGSVAQMVADLQARRTHYGFSYYVVSDEMMENFAPVVAQLNAQ